MKIKSIKNIHVKGKRVFIRTDFDVPLNEAGEIRDETRIKTSIPTLQYLVDNGAKVICASHLGRPEGKRKTGLTLQPVALELSRLLNLEVKFPGETIGKKVETLKSQLKEGDILLLENLRYHNGEIKNDTDFARELAKDIDIYVNDAFGASHRSHASIQAITRFVPLSAAGFLLKSDYDFLSEIKDNPPQNYTVILGGSKVSEKIPLIIELMKIAQKILLGGAMAYTFLKAKGFNVGKSKVEEDYIQKCKEILQKVKEKNFKLLLPVDHIAALTVEPEVTIRMIKKGYDIPEEMMGLDIGFETIQLFTRELKDAELIVWNGPLGLYEIDTFSSGTIEIAREVASSNATTFVGGCNSVTAINKAGVSDQFSHVSTGGAASMHFLSGKKLPGIESLSEGK